MKDQTKKSEFDQWYDEHKDEDFDLTKEAISYNENDMKIVHFTANYIRDFYKKNTMQYDPVYNADGTPAKDEDGKDKLDPKWYEIFRHCSTSASACNHLLRIKYLKKNTIPIMPENGYCRRGKQSEIGLKYLR